MGVWGGFSVNAQSIDVYFNGEKLEMETPSFMVDGRVLVCGHELFDVLGVRSYGFSGRDRRFSIYPGDGNFIRIQADNDSFIVRTRFGTHINVPLDVTMKIIDEQAFVPLRAVAEAFGAEVEWNGQSVIITKHIEPYQEITVSTAEEFVNAIGSDRTIYVNPGVYNFEPWIMHPTPQSTVSLTGFHVSGVSDLNIIGCTLGDVEFTLGSSLGITLRLEYSENVSVENIIFPDVSGDGYSVFISKNITFRNITSTYTYVGGDTENILYDNVTVTSDLPRRNVVYVIGSKNVVFTNSNFSNNTNNESGMFGIHHSSDVRIENSVISGNMQNLNWELLPSNPNVALFNFRSSNIVITGTEMVGNVFRHSVNKTCDVIFEYEDGLFDDNYFDFPEFYVHSNYPAG
jgi:hypothetical protein